jgi:hypothetical protein
MLIVRSYLGQRFKLPAKSQHDESQTVAALFQIERAMIHWVRRDEFDMFTYEQSRRSFGQSFRTDPLPAGPVEFRFRDGRTLRLDLPALVSTKQVKRDIARIRRCEWFEVDLFQGGNIVSEDVAFGEQVGADRPVFVAIFGEGGEAGGEWFEDLQAGAEVEDLSGLAEPAGCGISEVLLFFKKQSGDYNLTTRLLAEHRANLVLTKTDLADVE